MNTIYLYIILKPGSGSLVSHASLNTIYLYIILKHKWVKKPREKV